MSSGVYSVKYCAAVLSQPGMTLLNVSSQSNDTVDSTLAAASGDLVADFCTLCGKFQCLKIYLKFEFFRSTQEHLRTANLEEAKGGN